MKTKNPKPSIISEKYFVDGTLLVGVSFCKPGDYKPGDYVYTYMLSGDDVGRFKEQGKNKFRWLMKWYNRKGKKK